MKQTGSAKIRWASVRYGLVLIVVVSAAAFLLYVLWDPTPEFGKNETTISGQDPEKAAERARNLEVLKICLQIIGVGVVSAVLGFAAARIEAIRREHREAFEIRTELLDRSTRCAQTMYVACQHYFRLPKKEPEEPKFAWPWQPSEPHPKDALHEAYLAFAAEARSIQALIGARYSDEHGKDAAEPRAGYPWDAPPDVKVGESWWRWHQMYDLLTVYYFSLIKDFRGGKILANNALKHRCEYHSGLDFDEIAKPTWSSKVTNSPGCPEKKEKLDDLWEGNEFDRISRFIRDEFDTALPLFVEALRVDMPRKDG